MIAAQRFWEGPQRIRPGWLVFSSPSLGLWLRKVGQSQTQPKKGGPRGAGCPGAPAGCRRGAPALGAAWSRPGCRRLRQVAAASPSPGCRRPPGWLRCFVAGFTGHFDSFRSRTTPVDVVYFRCGFVPSALAFLWGCPVVALSGSSAALVCLSLWRPARRVPAPVLAVVLGCRAGVLVCVVCVGRPPGVAAVAALSGAAAPRVRRAVSPSGVVGFVVSVPVEQPAPWRRRLWRSPCARWRARRRPPRPPAVVILSAAVSAVPVGRPAGAAFLLPAAGGRWRRHRRRQQPLTCGGRLPAVGPAAGRSSPPSSSPSSSAACGRLSALSFYVTFL